MTKKLIKILPFVALGALLSLLFFRTNHKTSNQDLGTDETIIVGTNAEYPPFCYIKNNEIIGFDIDLISAVAHELNKRIVIKDMPFESLIPEIQVGSIQVIAAGISPTKERALQMFFTTEYLEGEPLIILSRKDNPIRSLEELRGKSVLVNEGFTADLYISSVENVSIIRLKTIAQAFLALRTGGADAFVTSQSSVKPFFDLYGTDEFIITTLPGTQETCAFGVSKQHQPLLANINQALEALEKKGVINELKQKWRLA